MIAAAKLIASDAVPKVNCCLFIEARTIGILFFLAEIFFLLVKSVLIAKIWLFSMQEYLASEIISHYVMHGTSVAEIVKHLITVLKKKEDDLAAIFLEALKKVRPLK